MCFHFHEMPNHLLIKHICPTRVKITCFQIQSRYVRSLPLFTISWRSVSGWFFSPFKVSGNLALLSFYPHTDVLISLIAIDTFTDGGVTVCWPTHLTTAVIDTSWVMEIAHPRTVCADIRPLRLDSSGTPSAEKCSRFCGDEITNRASNNFHWKM